MSPAVACNETLVVPVHRLGDAIRQHRCHGVGGAVDGVVEQALVFGRELAEDVVYPIRARLGLADADSQTGELLRAQRKDDRLDAAMAARTAFGAEPDVAQRECVVVGCEQQAVGP
jgi:hypothetical protein|tara:strand:+ start:355 stop:702 length:348 start_codon:yes stop_codon:yes gene_type:complete